MRPLTRWQVSVIMGLARSELQAGATIRWLLLWAPMWPLQLEARAYPGQPTHHSTPPVPPCSCVYHVARTPDDGVLVVPAPRPVAGYAHADLFMFEPTPYAVWYPRCPVLSWFTIRRTCPHHGVNACQ